MQESDDAVHARLEAFRRRHYTAQSMTLCVQSQQELDTLQEWVAESFAGVPNNGQEREGFSGLRGPFDTPTFRRLYRVAPVTDRYQVDVSWSLPPIIEKFRVKPLHYVEWIVGHEGRTVLRAIFCGFRLQEVNKGISLIGKYELLILHA